MARVTKKIVLSITFDDVEETSPETWDWETMIGGRETGPAGPGEIALTTDDARRGVEWDEQLQQWIDAEPKYWDPWA